MSDILLSQHLAQLDRLGFFEMAAQPEHAEKVMRSVKFVRPDVRMVGRVRNGVLGQVVFLPAQEETVRGLLREDLAVFEAGVTQTREILAAF